MAKRPVPFTQAALQRAIRAAKNAGLQVDRVEIEACGKLVIVTKGSASPDTDAETALEKWLASNAHASQRAS